jgi:hypothetical protein
MPALASNIARDGTNPSEPLGDRCLDQSYD